MSRDKEKTREDWLCCTEVFYFGRRYKAGSIIKAEDLREPGKPMVPGKLVPASERHKYEHVRGTSGPDKKLALKEEYRDE